MGQADRHHAPARIVVPLDGSTLSERALGVAQVLAAILTASIDLLHVLDPTKAPANTLPTLRSDAERYLRDVATRFPADIPVTTAVLEGNPVEELLLWLNRAQDTIVAMSTHGRSGIQRFLFGSVADKVIRGATVPVAVVREATTYSDDLRNILVPLDGSKLADVALPVALELVRDQRTVSLVRVVDMSHPYGNLAISYTSIWSDPEAPTNATTQSVEEARSNLASTALWLRTAGYQVRWEVRTGRPSDEIIRAAETTGTDLIVMATHGWGGVRRWAFGSVTDEVVHRSQIPVVVIPPHTHVDQDT